MKNTDDDLGFKEITGDDGLGFVPRESSEEAMPVPRKTDWLSRKFPRAEEMASRFMSTPLGKTINALGEFSGGLEQGTLNLPANIANLPVNILNQIGATNIKRKIPTFGFAPNTGASELGQVSSMFLGPGALGVAGEMSGISKAINSIPHIAAAMDKASNIISRAPTISNVLKQSVLGGAVSPGNPLLGVTMGASASAAPAIYNALRPSKLFRGGLSSEELLNRAKQLGELRTPIGDVIESPTLKRKYENMVSPILGSGAYETGMGVKKAIENQSNDLFNELKGGIPNQELSGEIHSALNNSYENIRNIKNSNWDESNKIADEAGIEVPGNNISNVAKDLLKDIDKDSVKKLELGKSLVSKLEAYAKGNVTEEEKTFKRNSDIRALLNKSIKSNRVKGNYNEEFIYQQLKDALSKDMREAALSSGNNDVLNAYQKALKFHREEYVPYKDPEIQKYINEGGDSDTIVSSFVKGGKEDRSVLLNKLMSKLPDKNKNLLTAGYLSRGIKDDKIDPLQLKRLYNQLGEKQKNILFHDPKIRNKIDTLIGNINLNTEQLGSMMNRPTGQRALDVLLPLGSGSAVGFAGGIPGALVGAALPSLGANVLNRIMTSPAIRRRLINAMAKNPPKY